MFNEEACFKWNDDKDSITHSIPVNGDNDE